MARAAGMAELLRRAAEGTASAVAWLATIDADTVVPPGWLRSQLRYADQGWAVVTSARRQARAPRGFSHTLRALAAEPVPST